MDSRLFFAAGDLLVNIIAGALIAWACTGFIDTSWNMLVAMFVAMAAGMILAMVLFIPSGYFFGAMEVMLPLMLTGMFSAMFVGMAAAMRPVSSEQALIWGGVIGLITILLVWVVNSLLRGKRSLET